MPNLTSQSVPFSLSAEEVYDQLSILEEGYNLNDLVNSNINELTLDNVAELGITSADYNIPLNPPSPPTNEEVSEQTNTTSSTEETGNISVGPYENIDGLEVANNVTLQDYDTSKVDKFEELLSEDANLTTSKASDAFSDLVENPKGEDNEGSGEKSNETGDGDKNDGSASNLTNSDEDNDLIAGKVMAEARAAVKGSIVQEDAVNLSMKAKKTTKETKESLDAAQQGSTTERNGKVTEGSEEVLKTANQTISKAIDELVESKATNSGIRFSANDAISFSTHKGINLSTSGAITNIAAQKNDYSNVLYTSTEYSYTESNLSNTDTNIKVDNSKNSISRNVNSLEYSRNREINTEVTSLNATEALQTASKERVEVFENAQTQGGTYKLSVEKNQINNIGESLIVSVGSEVPNKTESPAFNPLSVISDVASGKGGYLLSITPDTYDLQQEGAINIHSSQNQTYVADSITDISDKNRVSLSKQNIISYTPGNEFRVSNNMTTATLLGGGTSILGRFSFMGGLFGMISNVAEIASNILPGLSLPSDLPMPPIGERPNAGLKVDIDACIPSKYKDYISGTSPEGSSEDLNSDISNDISSDYSFSDSPILDDLTNTGNLDQTLDNTYSIQPPSDLGETFNAGPIGDITLIENEGTEVDGVQDENAGDIISGTEVDDLDGSSQTLDDPIPSEDELVESLDEKKPTSKEWTSGRGVETSQGFSADSKTKNQEQPDASTQKKSKTGSSLSSTDNKSSSKGVSREKRMKVWFAPHTYFDLFEEDDFEYNNAPPYQGDPMDVGKTDVKVEEGNTPELNKIAKKSIEDSIESSNLEESSKEKLLSNTSNVLNALSSLNITNSEEISRDIVIGTLSTLNLNLDENEKDILYHSYLELNGNIALSIGIFGTIMPLIQDAANVASNVFSQVSSISSMVGIDIEGGFADSVMSVIDQIKGGLNVSSVASLLDSSGELSKFIPVGQSIIAMLNNPEGKVDIKDTIINTLLPQVESLVQPILGGYDSISISNITTSISNLLSDGALDGMGPEEILLRAQGLLSQSNILPDEVNTLMQSIGPLLTSFSEGGSINSLIGGDLISQITSSLGIDMSPVSNVIGNLEGIVGSVNALLTIPSILDAMNDYDIPLLTQISSAIECVDLFSRIKDIIGIVKDPLNYQSQFSNPGALQSLGLPIDSSMTSIQGLMTGLLGDDILTGQSSGIISSTLGVISTLRSSLGSFSLAGLGDDTYSNNSSSEGSEYDSSSEESVDINGISNSSDELSQTLNNEMLGTQTIASGSSNSYNLINEYVTDQSNNIIPGFYSEPRIRSIDTIEGETLEGYFSVDELGNVAVRSQGKHDCEDLISRIYNTNQIVAIEENLDLDNVEFGTYVPLDENNPLNPDYNLDGLISYNDLMNDPNYRIFFEDPELGEFEIKDSSIYLNDIGVSDINGNPLGFWTSGVNNDNGGLDIIRNSVYDNVNRIYDEDNNLLGVSTNNNNINLETFDPNGLVSTINYTCEGRFSDFINSFKRLDKFNRFIILNEDNIFEVLPYGSINYNNTDKISYSYSSKVERFDINTIKEISVMIDNRLLLQWSQDERF